MKTLSLILLFFLSTPASAEIYRCTIDGKTTFRDKPCQASEVQSEIVQPKDAMAGCYEVDAPGWETGRNIFKLKIVSKGGGSYGWVDIDHGKKDVVPMRRATSEELRQVTEKLHFQAMNGVVMVVPKDMPNQPPLPIGMYQGKDEYRDTVYLFYGYLVNGMAKRIPCS